MPGKHRAKDQPNEAEVKPVGKSHTRITKETIKKVLRKGKSEDK